LFCSKGTPLEECDNRTGPGLKGYSNLNAVNAELKLELLINENNYLFE
jgi:hypothetical protein